MDAKILRYNSAIKLKNDQTVELPIFIAASRVPSY